ncbi:UDP-N-acetylmuramoyl-L-alanyl-D-glutamate--2,6-diaminopimelate ligase [Polymorphobacter sp.]|uniref:UDP-N-acetylmuramoyl-L-alanyl-D-glutamate--2, 6-diaminopimelate ligase n=1 Tax=Polymorphobacter sp. TaxID=1909290 RepID=UPI003F730186
MRLDQLDPAGAPRTVSGFAIDHRKVAPGTVFGAFVGARVNGEQFIPAAVEAGAIAIVARPQAVVSGALHIADANPRARFAALAGRFFGPYPAHVAAVTGTNGKTSTVELARQLWALAGHRAASLGTLGLNTGDGPAPTGGLTSPDIITFLQSVQQVADAGITHLAYEASSHGLDQHRSEGLPVMAAAFSNLSRDHLDYHGTMEAYFTAKLRLFTEVLAPGGTAVVWADDAPWSARVIDATRARGLKLITVGAAGETLRLEARTPTALGQQLRIAENGTIHDLNLPLIGAYQAANALLAAGLVIATGGDPAGTLANLARLAPVRGRLERAAITRAGAPVYVDYAHTPDALAAAAAALRPHSKGRLILVFGAGGDRDRGKRPLMGEVAIQVADRVIVTDDNPRHEDPAAIRHAILEAAPGAQDIADRRAAIAAGIDRAGGDDVVLIAGKGHEQGQLVGDKLLPFDDAEIARELCR